MIVKNKKGQVVKVSTPMPGDKILAGDYFRNQRTLMLAETEEIRLHGSNGGYMFSVRLINNTPTLFFDTAFSQQRDEYETPVELYPWLKVPGQSEVK